MTFHRRSNVFFIGKCGAEPLQNLVTIPNRLTGSSSWPNVVSTVIREKNQENIKESWFNEKKDSKQCLSDTPRSNGQWRKLIHVSRIRRPHKMAKFEKQLFNQKHFFGRTILHAHAQYIYIVNAKCQKPQAKSLIKSKQEKNGSFQKAVILSKKKIFFLASNFFMHMFNVSVLCRQSIR